jgi:hypothetical protein
MFKLTAGIVGLLASQLAGAAIGTVSLIPLYQPAAGAAPVSFVVEDFNHDGKPDLAVVDQRSATVRILLGLGNGFFEPWVDYQVGINPVAIAVGDFNGDGKPDLAVASQLSNTVTILLGNGDATFRALPTLEAHGPTSLVVADFNRDGKMDLAAANATSNSVSIWLGIGEGFFQPALDFRVGENPAFLVAADFNGDGKLDLATANLGSNNVSILLGTGTGQFPTVLDFPAGLAPIGLTLGDFNGDGKLDLAVLNATGPKSSGFMSTVSILLGNGHGFFQLPLTSVAAAKGSFLLAMDLNHDGKLDLAVTDASSNSLKILLGLGNGFFAPPLNFAVGKGPAWIAPFYSNLIVANSLSDNLSVLSLR